MIRLLPDVLAGAAAGAVVWRALRGRAVARAYRLCRASVENEHGWRPPQPPCSEDRVTGRPWGPVDAAPPPHRRPGSHHRG